jgi:DNA-binding transcriptional LysR family regulator
VFGMVVRRRTTVAAAEALGMSQSAVSLALSDLEARLGFPLFLRDRGRLEPTEAARALLAEIEPLFARLGVVETRAADIRDGALGRLRIAATPPLGHSVVPRALRRFLETRPEVQVQYDVARLDRVMAAVADGRTEIGLALGVEDGSAQPVEVRVLRRDRMIALVPEGHPLADRASVRPEDLAGHPQIGLERSSPLGEAVRRAFGAQGVGYAPQVEVRYCHTAAVLADAGTGLAVVDRYTAMYLSGMTLRQIPFEPAVEVPACLLKRRGQPGSHLAAAFAEEVEAAL